MLKTPHTMLAHISYLVYLELLNLAKSFTLFKSLTAIKKPQNFGSEVILDLFDQF